MSTSKTDIFISYRHSDSAASARSIRDRLVLNFQHVYLDVSNIRPGEHIIQDIQKALSSCHTLLVIIGKSWLNATNERGRRLDHPDDVVRLEILTAFQLGLNIIPILVDDADMPKPSELPAELTWLTQLSGLQIRHAQFDNDINELITSIRSFSAYPDSETTSANEINDITGTWEGTITRGEGKHQKMIKCRYVFLESPSPPGPVRHYEFRVEYLGLIKEEELVGPRQSMYGSVALEGNSITPLNLPEQVEKMNARPWVHYNMTVLDPRTIKGHYGYRLKVLWMDKKMFWSTLLIHKTSDEVDPYYKNLIHGERLKAS